MSERDKGRVLSLYAVIENITQGAQPQGPTTVELDSPSGSSSKVFIANLESAM